MSFHLHSESTFTNSQKELCTELISFLKSIDIHTFYFYLSNSLSDTIVLNVYPNTRIFINTSLNLDSIKRNLPLLLTSTTCSICEERECRVTCGTCTFSCCNSCFVHIWITNHYTFNCPTCRTPSSSIACKNSPIESLDKLSVKLLNLPELNNVPLDTAVAIASR